MSAEKNDFREQKTNWLSAFHLFDGFAMFAFSLSSISSAFRLNTFGSPSRSVIVCDAIYTTADLACKSAEEYRLYFIRDLKSTSIAYQVDFFF